MSGGADDEIPPTQPTGTAPPSCFQVEKDEAARAKEDAERFKAFTEAIKVEAKDIEALIADDDSGGTGSGRCR